MSSLGGTPDIYPTSIAHHPAYMYMRHHCHCYLHVVIFVLKVVERLSTQAIKCAGFVSFGWNTQDIAATSSAHTHALK